MEQSPLHIVSPWREPSRPGGMSDGRTRACRSLRCALTANCGSGRGMGVEGGVHRRRDLHAVRVAYEAVAEALLPVAALQMVVGGP